MLLNFHDDAKKAMSKIDNKTKGRIFDGLLGLPSKGDIKALTGKKKGKLRLRIGDWRVVYYIKDDIIEVLEITPRGGAYE